MFSNTLKLHTKANTTVRGRPTLKDVERFWNGSNLMRGHVLYERSTISEQVSDTFIEHYAISNEISIELFDINVKSMHKHHQVSRCDREPSKIPIRTVERLKNKNRKFSMHVCLRTSVQVYPNRLHSY